MRMQGLRARCSPAGTCAQVAVAEVRRLQRFGVTAGELERYKMALLRDSGQAAEQARAPVLARVLALHCTAAEAAQGAKSGPVVRMRECLGEASGVASGEFVF
jgi:hypothetical protein